MLKRCDMRFHVCSVTYVFVFLCAFYFLFFILCFCVLTSCCPKCILTDVLYKCVLFRWVIPNAYLQMCSVQMSCPKCVLTDVLMQVCSVQMSCPKCVLTDVLYKCVLFRWVGPQMRTYRCALQMCSVQMRCPKMRFSKLAYLWGLRACFSREEKFERLSFSLWYYKFFPKKLPLTIRARVETPPPLRAMPKCLLHEL